VPLDPNYLNGNNGQNAKIAAALSHHWKRAAGKLPYAHALELQELIMNDCRNPDLKPLIRAGLARAYVELEMLKLRLKMKPAPKPVDVQPRKQRKPAAGGFTFEPATKPADPTKPPV
jgi:hypothetical protein